MPVKRVVGVFRRVSVVMSLDTVNHPHCVVNSNIERNSVEQRREYVCDLTFQSLGASCFPSGIA